MANLNKKIDQFNYSSETKQLTLYVMGRVFKTMEVENLEKALEMVKHFNESVLTNLTYDDMSVWETSELREELERRGYFTYNLWQNIDVQGEFEDRGLEACSDEVAQKILRQTFKNEATIEQIWFSMRYAIDNFLQNQKPTSC